MNGKAGPGQGLDEVELQPIMAEPQTSGEARDQTWREALRGWAQQDMLAGAARNLMLICIWYFLSTSLSLWNKMLVGKDRGLFGKGPFPAPILMSSVQFIFQHFLARACLWSGLIRRHGSDEKMAWPRWWRAVFPNGVATGLDIGLSNYSLVFISLSFYVMCKSTVPLFLLAFAIMWRIEKPSWDLAGVVCVISIGLMLLVAGEVDFHLVGFLLVMTASALAGLRWTITQVLLQGSNATGHGALGGPVEVILHLTPVMSATLGVVSLAHEQLWNTLPSSPYFAGWGHCLLTAGIVATGAVIAFLMVWAEFALIGHTSALTFMVAGTFKEVVTVAAAVLFLGERFTPVNAAGLVVLIIGVTLFNWQKYRKLRQKGLALVVGAEDEEIGSLPKGAALGGGPATGARGIPALGSPYGDRSEVVDGQARPGRRRGGSISPVATHRALRMGSM
ncbi:hypothetical protein ACKKBF_B37790 [Auxenochlorella protothecoides x Auxenochlorella symbiontica]